MLGSMASKTTAAGDTAPCMLLRSGVRKTQVPVMVLRSGNRNVQGSHNMSPRPTKRRRKDAKQKTSAADVTASEPTWADKECDICAEEKPLSDFPLPIELPSTCREHCLGVCRSCIRRSLARDIANRPLDRIRCPICVASWDYETFQTHASPEDFATYDGLKLLQVLEAMPEYRACPNPDCRGGQIHAMGEAEPIVTCSECGFRSCYTHRVAWHTDLTCDGYDHAQEAEQETEEQTRERLAAEEEETLKGAPGIKFCPGCNIAILKNGGCDHMTC